MYNLQLFKVAELTQPIESRLLATGSLTIGRDPQADWSIDDPQRVLSRWHCEFVPTPDGLAVSVTGANGVFFAETGVRLPDGVQTALRLPCSLELGSFRLVASDAPHGVRPINPNMTMVMLSPMGESSEVASDWEDGEVLPEMAGGSLLEAFCEGAGIDSSQLSSEEPDEIMRRAGAIYRQMLLGIGDLMVERNKARSQYEMRRTTIGGIGNNPFKWAPTQRLALDLLLSGPSSFLSGPAAVQSSFRDIKQHLIASFAGLQACLRTVVDTFSPARLGDASPEKSSFFKSDSGVQLEELKRRHEDLVAQLDEGRQGSLDRAFANGYDAADVAARQTH